MCLKRKCLEYIYNNNKKKEESIEIYMKKKKLLMCRLNNTAHDYPIVITVKSSNHMFAYSFFFFLYQLLDIFHRRLLLLLLQRCMAVVRSTLCLDVHQPQSFISVERRRKRISFLFSSFSNEEGERKDGGGRTFLFFSRPFLCCAQQFANLFSIAAANRTLLDMFFPLFCFAYIQVLLLVKCLPDGCMMSSTTD